MGACGINNNAGDKYNMGYAKEDLRHQMAIADKWIRVCTYVMIAFLVALCGLLALAGCEPKYIYVQDPIVQDYKKDLLECVEKSGTLKESKHCRSQVEAKYAPYKDAGTND